MLKYFVQTIKAISDHDFSNIFFKKVSDQLLLVSLVYLAATLLLFLVTIPVVRKVKTKIK